MAAISQTIFAIPGGEQLKEEPPMYRRTTRILPVLVVLVLSLGVAACSSGGGSSAQAKPKTVVIRAASGDPQNSPTSEALAAMAKMVEQKTNGRIKFNLYYYTSLGTNPEKYTLLKQNSIQILTTQPGFLAADFPAVQVVNLPYAFPNRTATYAALDGPAGSYLSGQALAATHSVVKILGYGEYGSEGILNKVRPITSPASMKGLKIRPAPGDIAIDDLKALGAAPADIDYTEMYTGLVQGVVDGGELPIPSVTTAKLDEVAKYWTNTQDFISFEVLLMNNNFFKTLSASDQKIIADAATASLRQERASNQQGEVEDTKTVQARGGVVTALTPAQFGEFRTAVAPVDQEWVKKLGPVATQFVKLAGIQLPKS
jgi:TRAP-type C4-dicarboxylate transport system substrate-binding protein